MTGQRDVAARLSEGRPAVDNTQTYVGACQVLGYRQPDLTGHARQVHDWYESEAGLDLSVLDDDCAALWAASTTAEQALATHRAQLAELAGAWRGSAADCAIRFLQRHCDAAAAVAARVRAAAEGCSALRDNLWQLVDGKVATAIAIDDRALADRPAWLAAAHAVRTGLAAAEEVIRFQVNPYVDNDIRVEWLTVMRSTAASVDASFDAVTDGLAGLPGGCFEAIGDLGPSPSAVSAPRVASPPAVPTVPAAVPPPSSHSPAPPTAGAAPAPDSTPPGFPEPVAPPAADATGLPGGPGDLAGVVGGVVGRIVDGIGDLLGSLAGGLADAVPDDPFEADEQAGEQAGELADEADEPVEDRPDAHAADEAGTDDVESLATDRSPSATADLVEDSTSPEDSAAPAEPPTASEPPPADKTPCEIAADELPQAGQ